MLVGNKKGLHGHFVKGLRLKLTQFAVKNELVVREMHPWSRHMSKTPVICKALTGPYCVELI